MNVAVKFKRVPGINLPEYKTAGAAGADVKAFIKKDIIIKPGDVECVPTGLFLEIPNGYEIQIRPRSGLAATNKITVLNSPGTIDSDYRGEIKVILYNASDTEFVIHNGDRIAQMVLAPYVTALFEPVESLEETERGDGGFGHTGTK